MIGRLFVGCAGWNVPKEHRRNGKKAGSHLEQYARIFSSVEINSSFYRPHRPSTYERWSLAVPEDFRFSVKAPKSITHERRLIGVNELLASFADQTARLGTKLGCILFQLPPSLPFDLSSVEPFARTARDQLASAIVFEPRHASWFSPDADELLRKLGVARVAADPAAVPLAALPGGSDRVVYFRWHGSPRTYYSSYSLSTLTGLASTVASIIVEGRDVWCVFDNTALGAAFENALSLVDLCKRCSGETRHHTT